MGINVEYLQYKGKGEHSVRELENIIEQREEELHLIKSNTPSPEYEINYCPYCVQMTNHLNNKCQKHHG